VGFRSRLAPGPPSGEFAVSFNHLVSDRK
jgi:hypothetical protein